jgi:outer membrane immunogenic protein
MLYMPRLNCQFAALAPLCAIALAPLAANAADLYRNSPPAPSYAPPAAYVAGNIWQGFYAGLNGGYGWSNGGDTVAFSDGASAPRAQPQGGFGGGQIGYNLQSSGLVFGFETDFQGADLSAANSVSGSKVSADWFGTARGRLGLSFGQALFYGTGGFAYGNVREQINSGPALSHNGVETGWVAGGGIEYKFSPAWSVKSEYQHIDLGGATLSNPAASVTANAPDTVFDTVRLGLNYRFGGSAGSLK